MERKKQERIRELEYKIGMGLLDGKEVNKAKEQLLVLLGAQRSYSYHFMM
jgi:hypothetical protein